VGQVGGVGEEGEDQLDWIGHPLAGFEMQGHGIDGTCPRGGEGRFERANSRELVEII
jgi:hypothetical protein